MQATLDTNIIDLLAAAVAKQVRPAIPIDIALWDIATIAAYLNRGESQVRERMACLPDFPKAIRLPSANTTRGHALYKAKEIIAWASKFQDKN
jgi:hypothetical protein